MKITKITTIDDRIASPRDDNRAMPKRNSV